MQRVLLTWYPLGNLNLPKRDPKVRKRTEEKRRESGWMRGETENQSRPSKILLDGQDRARHGHVVPVQYPKNFLFLGVSGEDFVLFPSISILALRYKHTI